MNLYMYAFLQSSADGYFKARGLFSRFLRAYLIGSFEIMKSRDFQKNDERVMCPSPQARLKRFAGK